MPDPDVTRVTLLSRDADSSDHLELMGNNSQAVLNNLLPSSSCNSSITSSLSSSNPMSASVHESSSQSSGNSDDFVASSSSSSGSPLNRDEVFILAFAIIMLNTDLHVPSNKTRMTCVQWIKNLKVIVISFLLHSLRV